MITILSPAKTIDENPARRFENLADPMFLKEANYLASLLKKLSATRLRKLMNISQELAELNQERYIGWEAEKEN